MNTVIYIITIYYQKTIFFSYILASHLIIDKTHNTFTTSFIFWTNDNKLQIKLLT